MQNLAVHGVTSRHVSLQRLGVNCVFDGFKIAWLVWELMYVFGRY